MNYNILLEVKNCKTLYFTQFLRRFICKYNIQFITSFFVKNVIRKKPKKVTCVYNQYFLKIPTLFKVGQLKLNNRLIPLNFCHWFYIKKNNKYLVKYLNKKTFFLHNIIMCLSVSGYVDDGRHFQVHSSDCTKYVEVVPGVGGTLTFIKSCSFGLFWDEISLTCVNSTQADCFNGKLFK